LENITPSRASRSRAGVWTNGCPAALRKSHRWSSLRMKRMLGLGRASPRGLSGFAAPCAPERGPAPRRQRKKTRAMVRPERSLPRNRRQDPLSDGGASSADRRRAGFRRIGWVISFRPSGEAVEGRAYVPFETCGSLYRRNRGGKSRGSFARVESGTKPQADRPGQRDWPRGPTGCLHRPGCSCDHRRALQALRPSLVSQSIV